MATNKKIPSTSAPLATRPLTFRIDTQPEDVRVEVVPLIDVVFCILVFFILAALSLSRQQAISVDLPKASTGTSQGREILAVALNESGQVFVDQQPVPTKDQFLEKLRDYHKKNPAGIMALYAPTNATYNQVVQVLDLLREVGGDRVALATIPGETQGPFGSTPGVPPATGVPGVSSYPGMNPSDPYGTNNPASQLNPTQPQVPSTPGQGLPGLPGTTPGNLQPLPGQSQNSLGNPTLLAPGTTVPPNTNNTAPQQNGSLSPALPAPGVKGSLKTDSATPQQTGSGNSVVPAPGATGSSKTNNAPPRR